MGVSIMSPERMALRRQAVATVLQENPVSLHEVAIIVREYVDHADVELTTRVDLAVQLKLAARAAESEADRRNLEFATPAERSMPPPGGVA